MCQGVLCHALTHLVLPLQPPEEEFYQDFNAWINAKCKHRKKRVECKVLGAVLGGVHGCLVLGGVLGCLVARGGAWGAAAPGLACLPTLPTADLRMPHSTAGTPC